MYISQSGSFYNQYKALIAEDMQGFFDYVVNFKFPLRNELSETARNFLTKRGVWYDGRSVDISAFETALSLRGITLSEAQRRFFAEFSGTQTCSIGGWQFPSLEEVLKYLKHDKNRIRSEKIIGENFVSCGIVHYYIDTDGIIYYNSIPLGRTTLECIDNLCCWATTCRWTVSNKDDQSWWDDFVHDNGHNIILQKPYCIIKAYTE